MDRICRALVLFCLAAMSANAKTPPAAPPVAERKPVLSRKHGDTRSDDYHWLRDKGSAAVTAYLQAENAYTAAVTQPLAGLRQRLYQEMLGRIQETDQDVPYRDGGYWYYARTEQGLQYPIFCRRRGTMNAPEEVVLDLNRLAAGRAYTALGLFRVSPNGGLLAYSIDHSGFREYQLYFKDLRRNRSWKTGVRVTGFAWANDNRHYFYVTEDAAKRSFRLYRGKLGVRQASLVYEERDALFSLGIARSRSGAYLILSLESALTSEQRYLDANLPRGAFRSLLARRPNHEYEIAHHGDRFFIRSNDRGRNFRLVSAPIADPSEANWVEEIPARDDVMLEGVDMFRDFYVAIERVGGFRRLRVYDFAARRFRAVDFD